MHRLAAVGRLETAARPPTTNEYSRPEAARDDCPQRSNESPTLGTPTNATTADQDRLEEGPRDASGQQTRISAGCVESLVLGSNGPRAELVLRAYTASAARVRAIQLDGIQTKVASARGTIAIFYGAFEARGARLQIDIHNGHGQV